ncbi:MAG: dimethylarginine dimethylaminohydrolase family protein [Mycoplasmoidaceae bacterium]
MLNFKNVITKTPGKSITKGIASGDYPGTPDYELALKQHDAYKKILRNCGVEVKNLEADEAFPDSCFVEDTAVFIPGAGVILANPGAAARNKEIVVMEKVIKEHFYNKEDENFFKIKAPGTLDAGDVMMVGDTYYIGESNRTNKAGIEQFKEYAAKLGKKTILAHMDKGLHLKSGVNYLEISPKTNKPVLLINSDFVGHELFDNDHFDRIYIPDDEKYAANCVWMNNVVIVPQGFNNTLASIKAHGYQTVECDTSEYRKLDGGLSCLSLRF